MNNEIFGGGIISILEIDLKNIAKNLKYYKRRLNSNQRLCLVAKSNCYGFGSKICHYFNDFVDYFAVFSLYEYKKIKKYINKPVLILDPVYDKKELTELIKNNCELTVSNLKSVELILQICKILNKQACVHIAINTGMNRFGFSNIEEINLLIDILKKTQNIKIKGIFSHYFDSNNNYFANFQLKRFKYYVSLFEGICDNMPLIHISATSGVENSNFGNMARVGYGIYSDEFHQTINLKTKILEIQHLNKGDCAGYSSCFIAEKKCKIAVIGIGYGDGIMRNIVSKGYVIIAGKLSKILAICMDSMIVDISGIKCSVNDNAIIIGKMSNVTISICDIACWCDTIGYEIIVRLSNRIKRVYKGSKECRLYLENLEQGN